MVKEVANKDFELKVLRWKLGSGGRKKKVGKRTVQENLLLGYENKNW